MEIIYHHKDAKRLADSFQGPTKDQYNRLIKILTLQGYTISMPHSRRIEKDLYELRVKSIQNIRVFYTFYDNKAVILHVIIKKTQKLEKHDLETARQRLFDLQRI